MRRMLLIVVAALVLVPAALADGGPDPGVLEAGAGITGGPGSVRFVTVPVGVLTLVERTATQGGQVLSSRLLPGSWGIPLVDFTGTTGGLSANGQTLVLGQTGAGTCTASGCTLLRRTTSFRILDATSLRPRETVTLRGDFAFDALSPDGLRLYLVNHVSAANANKYVVRAFDLRHQRLLPGAIADRTQRGWLMQGMPMARQTSGDGRYVYTLYANPGGYPFVHALDTVAGRAHCIGIPWTHELTKGDLDVLELSANGSELTVGAITGRAADRQMYFTVDTRTYRIAGIAPTRRNGFPWLWTLAPVALMFATLVVLVHALRRRRATAAPRRAGTASTTPATRTPTGPAIAPSARLAAGRSPRNAMPHSAMIRPR
jgi:hypothetical protein